MKLIYFLFLAFLLLNTPIFAQEKSNELLYSEAQSDYLNSDYENAVIKFNRLVKNGFIQNNLNLAIGLCYENMGMYPLAIDNLKLALVSDSLNLNIYLNLAKCYKMVNKINSAIEYYNKAIILKKDCYNAYFELGLIYFERNKYLIAMDYFKKCDELKPNSVLPKHYLGLCCFNSEISNDSALAWFFSALKIDSNFVQSLNSAGSCYYSMKDYDNAILSFSRSLNLENESASTNRKLGNCYYKLGKNEEALILYKKAYYYGDTSQMNISNIAWAYYKLGQADSAIKFMKILIKEDPNEGRKKIDLAGVLMSVRNYEEASMYFSIGISQVEKEVFPTLTDADMRYGITLHLLKKYNNAMDNYKKALAISPGFPLAFYNMGVSQEFISKNKKEAIKTYEDFLNLAKENTEFTEYVEKAKERIRLLKGK